jgi:predicted PurR-regulated permease PerM
VTSCGPGWPPDSLNAQQNLLVGKAATAATAAGEFLIGTILMLFVTFFLLKDGETIWRWTRGGFGSAASRVDRAGQAAWRTLSHYMHGTVIIAAIHSAVMATVLSIMGVPMVAALTMLIFIASFIPIIGIIVAGGLAVLVTFGAKGPVFALILIGILIIEQQLENHILQPLVVGKLVRLHPLAIILALATGGIVGGIPGAAFAVPLVAALSRAWPQLTTPDPEPTDPKPKQEATPTEHDTPEPTEPKTQP